MPDIIKRVTYGEDRVVIRSVNNGKFSSFFYKVLTKHNRLHRILPHLTLFINFGIFYGFLSKKPLF